MYQLERPGTESYRKTREDLTTMDKLHMALTELCYSINFASTINVWEYTFAPREYLNQHLETRFARALSGETIAQPTGRKFVHLFKQKHFRNGYVLSRDL